MSQKIKVTATEESLIQTGKELINSHIHFASGALHTSVPKEIVIYILEMNEKELVEMEDSAKSEKRILPRFKKNGTQSERGYSCFSYEGRIYGVTRAVQMLEVIHVEIQADSKVEAFWKWVQIEGKLKKCLVLSNQIEEGMGDKERPARVSETLTPEHVTGFDNMDYLPIIN